MSLTASKLLSHVSNAFMFWLLVALEEKENNKKSKLKLTELIY